MKDKNTSRLSLRNYAWKLGNNPDNIMSLDVRDSPTNLIQIPLSYMNRIEQLVILFIALSHFNIRDVEI